LLGLFFIAVGASINFALILKNPLMIIGIVLLVMTIKAIVLFSLGEGSHLRKDQNTIFALGLSQVGEFAFVLFSFSQQEGILSKEIVDTMMAVVAISMALTPLVMLFNDKILQPRLQPVASGNERAADEIDESNPVIIAGFGHFGNTVGRMLRAHNIGATILDVNGDRVDTLRKMGFKVYYGDASRHDLLASAGAASAKIIIISLEPAAKRLELIGTIKKHFPHLRMFVRAENRYDAYDLMNAGMLHVYRETIDTSIRLGVDVMKFLGYRPYTANRAARKFFQLDEANLKKLASINDSEEYIVTARSYIEELEKMLRADMEQTQPGRTKLNDQGELEEEGEAVTA
jgi:monovalent cation:H+ antiporter-2, CPA2 family